MNKKSKSVKNIWMLTREYGALAGVGGVKDVAAQLSRSLARWSARKVSVVLPLYGFIEPDLHGFRPLVDPLFDMEELEY
jgi:starch synthase